MTSGKRLHFFNENLFDNIITSEQSYWLGFLYGDGSVDKYSLTIELGQKDIDNIKKFCQLIG